MIGFVDPLQGRLGNQLLQYLFLSQIGKYLQSPVFYPSFLYMQELSLQPSASMPWLRLLFRQSDILQARELRMLDSQEVLAIIQKTINQKKIVVLQGQFLGDFFFDYEFIRPDYYFLQDKKKDDIENSAYVRIGIHCRGTDFYTWDPHAILDSAYYKAAIEYCLEFYKDKQIQIVICSDDKNFEVYQQVCSYLLHLKNVTVFMIGAGVLGDFINLSFCDVLISSPSTFCIVAGFIGKPYKKIIHSKQWLEYVCAKQDLFWCKLYSGQYSKSSYVLWKSF